MKNALAILAVTALLLATLPSGRAASWPGVDEAVIEKVAEKAGRSAREPFINTDQGDLLLFAFLLAGIAGGFIAGYNFRTLFPPKRRKQGEPGASASAEAAEAK